MAITKNNIVRFSMKDEGFVPKVLHSLNKSKQEQQITNGIFNLLFTS